ncbi:MAG: FtsH protease activity modulator HflK [Azoarcus sp.]|jgi:membrane protease subunit HflK|nr:FtsH protease activity modulator HflK [Azoarcus sp.]
MSQNDPHWGNRNGNGERGGKRGDEQGPPDLEEIWRDFNQRLSGIFGNRRGKGPSDPRNPGGPGRPGLPSFKQFGGGFGVLVLLVLVIWLGSGFYTVDPNERGVVLRMGKYNTVTSPGLNWRLPWPIESHEIVDLTGLRTVSVGGRDSARALMLTKDMNIVAVQFAVQYVLKTKPDESDGLVRSPRDFIFENLIPPGDENGFVRQVAETAIREIAGNHEINFILFRGREEIAKETENRIQNILDRYNSGIEVRRVTMEEVQPPEQVQEAFNDAIRARQDEQRKKNEGEAYANQVKPAAEGQASRLRADAEAYRARVTAEAEGETARFRQVLSEFKRAPQVTRERMYLDAVQEVLSNSSKVMIDNKGGSNLLYLPLDKLAQQPGSGRTAGAATSSGTAQEVLPPPPAAPALQGNLRDRDFVRDRARGDR